MVNRHAIFVVVLLTPGALAHPSFQGLGELLGGDFLSVPNDVSADGSVVVGMRGVSGAEFRAFRWTRDTGIQTLAGLSDMRSDARGVSGDGRIIVGVVTRPNGTGPHRFDPPLGVLS